MRRRRRALRLRRRIYAFFLMGCFIAIICMIFHIKKNGDKKQYTAISHTVFLNGEPYGGRSFLASSNGDEFFPLSELAKALDVKDFKVSKRSIYWKGEEHPIKESDLLADMDWGGPKEDFIRVSSISEVLGLSVYSDDGVAGSIDSYPSLKYDWADKNTWIARSMGGIDKYPYTNSKEAFNKSYKEGIRVFEADISLTSDDSPVAVADWKYFRQMCGMDDEDGGALEEEAFLESRIYTRYTPLTYEDIFGLLTSNTDMYLVVDAHEDDPETTKKEMTRFLETAERFDASIFDRIIVQVASIECADVLSGLREWDSLVFVIRLSDEGTTVKDTVKGAMERGIRLFAIDSQADDDFLIDRIHMMGGKVFLRACDDAKQAKAIQQSKGIDGFYTSFASISE